MKAATFFCLASQALAIPLSATLSPLVASLNAATLDLTNAQVRLFAFHGSSLDLRSLKRQTLSALQSVSDIADSLGNGPRLEEADAAAIVGAANPIAIQTSLVVKGVQPKTGVLRSEILNEQAPEIIDAAADAINNLAAAIDAVAPRNWVKIFHDVNNIYINKINDARELTSPRQFRPQPIPVPVPVAVPYDTVSHPTGSYAPDPYAAPLSAPSAGFVGPVAVTAPAPAFQQEGQY